MIKILILFAVVILTTAIGSFLSANKKHRMQVFAEFYEFNEQLLLSLKFNRVSVGDVAKQFKYVNGAWGGSIPLAGDDRQLLQDYISSLGKSDALSQVGYLEEKQQFLKKYKEESVADYKKYNSLYIKIFFLIGVLIAILLA